jgi:aryl-alcohol dehydrogenase-like predicted oxidoreductase
VFGGPIGEQESLSVIHRALDLGINFIDTADAYQSGRSEELVGKGIKGKRSKVVLASKFGCPTGESPNECGNARIHIMEAIDASLKRLGTDHIDLYYVHWPDPTTRIEETLQTLDTLVQSGKVRYIGCSNFTAWQLCEALWISKTRNQAPFVAVQSRYNLLNRNVEAELVPCCQAYGVGIIPWGPLAEGALTGKYTRGSQAPAGTRLGHKEQAAVHNDFFLKLTPPSLDDIDFERVEKFKEFAAERGHTLTELAIAWLLSHPWLSSVISGATKPEHLSANVAAAEWKLTPQEVALLETM